MSYEEHTIKMTLVREIDDALVDVEVEVTGRVYPGSPGKMSGHPDTWYPPEDPWAEITLVEQAGGTEFELETDEWEEAEKKLIELENSTECYEENYED